MASFKEKKAVEDYILEKLQESGWKFRQAEELERESYQEPLLKKNLVRAIKRINDQCELTDEDIRKVLNELEYRSPGIEGIKEILRRLKEGHYVKLEKEKTLKQIKLIDDDKNIGKNKFIVARQVTYKSATNEIRPDIVLYVNGIPLVVIECKNPADPAVSWHDGYDQIKDYENKVPELFKYVQFSIAAAETAKYFPNVPWLDDVHIHTWKNEKFDILDVTLEMLSPSILVDLIQNFLFLREEKGKTNKVIARYMQYRAANKIFERVIRNLEGETEKNSGLVWHWQGSGKTLTMIFAAYKLFKHELLEHPSIFFIVDRQDLEEQLTEEFAALGIPVRAISSIEGLTNTLLHDSGKGERGIFISLVQKFRSEDLEKLREKLNKLKGRGEKTIFDRKNVIAFVDEGHRSQYGSLAAEMRRILDNAFFFAFTGTPIAKRGRDTYYVFSYPKTGERYLDRYFIKSSIEDGFTRPITFEPRLENEVHLKKRELERFLQEEFEEIPEEYRKEVEDRVRRRLDKIRVFMLDSKRIKKIAKDIKEHFEENVDGKFKAMVVGVNRAACLKYKKALDEILPKQYSEIVMTFGQDSTEGIEEYFKKLKQRYHKKDEKTIRKEIVRKFKEEEYPKILIVTNMLLTGFDAPILQTMYLDKPLKEHRLLQAIARTNRPYKGVKETGLIIDYVGISKEFEKAVAIYSKQDIKNVKEIAQDIEEKKKEFVELLNKTMALFEDLSINAGDNDRKSLMRTKKHLVENKDYARKFEKNYRKLKRLFELLGPDPVKAKYLQEFNWLSGIYYAYTRHIRREDPDETERYVKKYFKKTLDYIHKSIDIDRIRKDFPIISLDEKYLEKIEKAYPDLESRISDMIFTLNKFVLVDRTRNPVYESVADRVEKIVKSWEQRKKEVKASYYQRLRQETYEELKQAVEELNQAGRRQKELGLNNAEYYTLLVLEKSLGKDNKLIEHAKKIVQDVSGKIFKNWALQRSVVKDVEKIVRRGLRRYLKEYKLNKEKRDEIHGRVMAILKRFA